jgi:hypothetical protein
MRVVSVHDVCIVHGSISGQPGHRISWYLGVYIRVRKQFQVSTAEGEDDVEDGQFHTARDES